MNRNITLILTVISLLAFSFDRPQQRVLGDKKYIYQADSVLALMTLEEKIGQLNLPAGGDITTGQASSTGLGEKIIFLEPVLISTLIKCNVSLSCTAGKIE